MYLLNYPLICFIAISVNIYESQLSKHNYNGINVQRKMQMYLHLCLIYVTGE